MKPNSDQLIEEYAEHVQLHGRQVINEKFIDFLLHMPIGARFLFRENCRLLMTELLQQDQLEIAQIVHLRVIELVKESQEEENHNTLYGLSPMLWLGSFLYRHNHNAGMYVLNQIEQAVVKNGDISLHEYIMVARTYAEFNEIQAEERILNAALATLKVGTMVPGSYPKLAQYLQSRGHPEKADTVIQVLRETADTILNNQFIKMYWTKAEALIHLTEAFVLCGFSDRAPTVYDEAKQFIADSGLADTYLQKLNTKFHNTQEITVDINGRENATYASLTRENSTERLITETQNANLYKWIGVFALHTPPTLRADSQELLSTVAEILRISGWYHGRWQKTYQGFTSVLNSRSE